MSLKTLVGSGSGIIKKKIRIRIRNKSFRIRNPVSQYILQREPLPDEMIEQSMEKRVEYHFYFLLCYQNIAAVLQKSWNAEAQYSS